MKTPRRRWMSNATFSTVVAALAMTTSARGVAMEEEERLIGWKGEVAREPRAGAGAVREETAPRVTTLSWTPRVFLYENFLSDEECEHMIALGEKKLERSTVVGNTPDGLFSDVRSSYGTFVTRRLTKTLSEVEDRVAEFSGVPWEHQEQLQLLRYENGQEYKAHHDGLSSGENGGNRIATVLMFLSEPEEGGETAFPDAEPLPETKADFLAKKDTFSACGWNDGDGFSVKPKKGSAVLFFSFHINRTSDTLAGHASCPTLRGTKFTATKWIHESPFSTGTYVTPTCEDVKTECAGWASVGECEKNPGFMMGVESVGSCSKSCCARMDRSTLTEIQKTFCVPCDG